MRRCLRQRQQNKKKSGLVAGMFVLLDPSVSEQSGKVQYTKLHIIGSWQWVEIAYRRVTRAMRIHTAVLLHRDDGDSGYDVSPHLYASKYEVRFFLFFFFTGWGRADEEEAVFRCFRCFSRYSSRRPVDTIYHTPCTTFETRFLNNKEG